MLLSQYKIKELAALQTIGGLGPFTAFPAIQCHFPLLFLLTYKIHPKKIKNKNKSSSLHCISSGVFGVFWFATPIFGTADPSAKPQERLLWFSQGRVRGSSAWYLRPSFSTLALLRPLNCSFTSNCFCDSRVCGLKVSRFVLC